MKNPFRPTLARRVVLALLASYPLVWVFLIISVPYLMGLISNDVLYYITIAFPVMLLLAWLAVSHGLRPLRRLSQAIAARGAADLAPVGISSEPDRQRNSLWA